MNNLSENIYKTARKKAELTREAAAEELHIGTRTLDGYESMDGNPPDDVVRRMCILYNDRFLAYRHIKRSPLGEFIPDLFESNLQGATLGVVSSVNGLNSILAEIVDICADGQINGQEREVWEKNKPLLLKAIGALTELLLADKEG
ncbi:MAG: helix-turn-helix transcriptional regulator [Eubacterium sp.]|nr:helix-turn-helix transcriptional regulator [Eubacterium sp.]MBQ9229212.1 helix-turn-helix transcriptional regulator [Eubacterium sp.]